MKSKIPSVLLMKSPSVKDIPRVRYIEPLTSSSASPVINVPINCLIKKKKATTIIGPVITSAKYQHLSILYLPFVYFPASACVLTQIRMPVITPNSPQNIISNHRQKPVIQKNPLFMENFIASFSIFSISSFIKVILSSVCGRVILAGISLKVEIKPLRELIFSVNSNVNQLFPVLSSAFIALDTSFGIISGLAIDALTLPIALKNSLVLSLL